MGGLGVCPQLGMNKKGGVSSKACRLGGSVRIPPPSGRNLLGPKLLLEVLGVIHSVDIVLFLLFEPVGAKGGTFQALSC